MRPDVSICIATYRRPLGLDLLLTSLELLKRPDGMSVETIVVDNDETGSAREVAAAHAAALEPLVYLVEPRQNIAHARNRALGEARGRYVAFVDDDEFAEEQWLARYVAFLEEDAFDGLFGPVLPRLEREVTPWLGVEAFFGRPRHATGAIVPRAELRTSNAIVRAGLLGGAPFDPAYGRSGGSDTELFARLARQGARFGWCDEACVVEIVPPERHRLGWLARRAFRGGWVYTRLGPGRGGRIERLLHALRSGFGLLLFGAAVPIAATRGRDRAARVWLRACTQAGHLWALLRGSFVEYR